MEKNIAVILAGGIGLRLGETLPKQFLKIAGKKVIEHTIDVFQRHRQIDEIAVIVHTDYVRDMEEIALKNRFSKSTYKFLCCILCCINAVSCFRIISANSAIADGKTC